MSKEPNIIWQPLPGGQTKFLNCPALEVLFHGNRGPGKGLLPSELVLSVGGWIPMSELRKGTLLFNPDGSIQTVLSVHNRINQQMYRLLFNDGSSIDCDSDHIWFARFGESPVLYDNKYPIGFDGKLYSTKILYNLLNKGIDTKLLLPCVNPLSGTGKYVNTKEIVSIYKLIDRADTICITVSNKNRLFITKDFIITHNTDALLMDYAQDVGKGYGADYRGMILREATTELGDIIAKSKKWFPRIFPGSNFNNKDKIWTFPDGETLWFTYARLPSDYDRFHGQEFQFIGWEELTNHVFPDVYLKLMSCNRSSNSAVPLKYRATTNPSGPGRPWVKERFIDAIPEGRIFRGEVDVEYVRNGETSYERVVVTRAHVKGRLDENTFMTPQYKANLIENTQGNENLYKAWVLGSWDIVDGGYFNAVWHPESQLFHSFTLSPSWRVFRSFDWGGTKPWAVSYLCETDGTQSPDWNEIEGVPYLPKGSIIVIDEIYGWTGKPDEGDKALTDEMCERIHTNDNKIAMLYNIKPQPGPADSQIYAVNDGVSIGQSMAKCGVRWTKCSKGAGSRVATLTLVRQMLHSTKIGHLEKPHLIFFEDAANHIRTIPITMADERNPDDINTKGEDHLIDSLRYGIGKKLNTFTRGVVR